jgi:Raf kinase inhibitor-like YbhB/YbcL family protein
MRTKIALSFVAVACLSALGLHQVSAQQPAAAPPRPPLRISVPSTPEGETLPTKYSCAADGGKFVSPAVNWTNIPPGTTSFVLLFHDTDARPGKKTQDVTHWMIFNIPGDSTGLPENVTADSPASVGVQAGNIRNQPAYFGPCPPPGAPHHYIFELLALDTKLDLQAGASREDVMKAADGHIVGSAGYYTLFHR